MIVATLYVNNVYLTHKHSEDATLLIISKDTFDFAPSSRQYLDNGFLRVTGKAARTGVYQYLASELGLTDRKPNTVVNVLRSAEEVFNPASLDTYPNVDMTNNHPSALVDAETFKATSVGHVVSAKQAGDFVELDMIIKDADAIKAIESGKAQLSPGYKTEYVPEVGTYDATGETYEFKQTGIVINHVALVKRGRGGEQVRIDDNEGVPTMSVKVMFDGQALEVADEASAKLVTDALEGMALKVKDAESKAEKAQAKKDEAEEMLEEEKAKTTDAAISARVDSVLSVKANAVKIVGDSFTCDSMDTLTIQREALKLKRTAIDWDSKSAVYVESAFDSALESADEVGTNDSAQQLAKLSLDAAGQTVVEEPKMTRDQAYAKELYSKSGVK